jgi:hypothetical protein
MADTEISGEATAVAGVNAPMRQLQIIIGEPHLFGKLISSMRQLFGYDRFDKPQPVNLMNDLYHNEWRTFQNFFCPTFKLKEKQRVNSKYIKKYHPLQTPCQRLLESDHVCPETKNQLTAVLLNTNSFVLKKIIQAKLKIIFDALK